MAGTKEHYHQTRATKGFFCSETLFCNNVQGTFVPQHFLQRPTLFTTYQLVAPSNVLSSKLLGIP